MTISGSDALDILRKWMKERSPVLAMLESSDPGGNVRHAVKVTGLVMGIPDERSNKLLIADNPINPRNMVLILDADIFASYEYFEAKDLDKTEQEKQEAIALGGHACLSMKFQGGRLSIFEIGDGK
jgi:hypothetical protein